MTPTDADREAAREWIARQRSYDPVPELTVDLLAELVAAGRAAGIAHERERAAKVADDQEQRDDKRAAVLKEERMHSAADKYTSRAAAAECIAAAIRRGA